MNKEQIIEEMAIVLSKVNCKPEGCGNCYLEYGTLENSCEEYLVYKKMATALYNYYQHKNCKVNETQLFPSPYKYCPHCGAKMRGE
jgi:hypothetical protein